MGIGMETTAAHLRERIRNAGGTEKASERGRTSDLLIMNELL
jgi:hypothetical protein